MPLPHPGLSIRHDCLEPLGLSITEGADALGVSRQALNNLVNGKAAISPEMAIRLDKVFGGGAEVWLRMQMAFDLAEAMDGGGEIRVKGYDVKSGRPEVHRFPDNLAGLHQGEEALGAKSVAAIKANREFALHVDVIERSMDLFDYFARGYEHESDDQLTIQFLGIRLFNGTASALRLLLAGYYQTSALQQRDILETSFLLNYFSKKRRDISEWKRSDEATRQKKFSAHKIRTALDKRDGFVDGKRAAHYKLLCNLAGHPTYDGFRMLSPIAGGDAHCGPFFERTALKATLEELAKLAILAAISFTQFFTARGRPDYLMKITFMEGQAEWMAMNTGNPVDRSKTDELRAILARMGE